MNTAIILAAGRGERLKPITDARPKALCTVHNIPLIEYHIRSLAKAGYQKIIVNHAYLGGMIRQTLGDGERWGVRIIYSPEPPGGLETGGGIVNALPLIGNNPFLAINADIFTTYGFSALSLHKNRLAHLILVNKPDYKQNGDFGLSKRCLVENKNRTYLFTGIAFYHPKLFESYPVGRYSVAPLLRQAVGDNLVSGEIYNGQWMDVGSPERLLLANKMPLNH